MANDKDLFDDSTMTFGEHLEVLRFHLIRALMGLTVCVIVTLCYGEELVRLIRYPVDQALQRANKNELIKIEDNIKEVGFWESWKQMVFPPDTTAATERMKTDSMTTTARRNIEIQLSAHELADQLHQASPERYPVAADDLKDKTLKLQATSDAFLQFRVGIEKIERPVTFNVQEAFMTYMKISFVAGLILSSPWVFYQLWLFVAAGLYPHERKYIHIYLPMSIVLFLGGIFFCFCAVLPTVLDFLLGYNGRMGLTAQIRISEWINFAIMLPLMFGISFQLPLIMLFLAKINLFTADHYLQQWRIAVLAIAVISMVLTPTPDPWTMILMMAPLMLLYGLGVALCYWTRTRGKVEIAT
ncbi:MAG: twin-arginine translocase subunit TatC [Planctomycetota bacterium]